MSGFSDYFQPLAQTLARFAVGAVFLYHGAVKLMALQQWTHNFAHMGLPSYFAYIAGPLEAGGGVLLILGFLTRIFGLLLAGEMLIALIKVHLPGGPIWQVGRFELVMLLSAISFLFFAFGAGPWSLDAALGGRRRR